MAGSCCRCLPRACPGLREQSKSLHEAAASAGCLTCLSPKRPSCLGGASGTGRFPLPLCTSHDAKKLWDEAAWPCRSQGRRPGVGTSPWPEAEALGVRGQGVESGSALFRQMHSVQALGQDL